LSAQIGHSKEESDAMKTRMKSAKTVKTPAAENAIDGRFGRFRFIVLELD
jgi:hypothetical protein